MDTAFLQALQLVWPNKSLKTNNCSLCVIKGDILYADVGIIFILKRIGILPPAQLRIFILTLPH